MQPKGMPPLDYASLPVAKRRSKLAVASCIASAVSGPVSFRVAALGGGGEFVWILLGMILLFTIIGIYALARIIQSQGRLGGEWPAIGAMVLPGCWLLVIILFGGAIA